MTNNKQSSVDKEFVPYEEALVLKKIGYDDWCFSFYHKGKLYESERYYKLGINVFPPCEIVAPTFSQAFRWFREKYNLLHNISYVYKKTEGVEWFFDIKGINMTNNNILPHSEIRFEEYEKAEIACLRKLIEIQGGNK